jgi:hypothetical protein
MTTPPTANTASSSSSSSFIPGAAVNPLDMASLEEEIRWMMKGRVDSTGLAKYFPHTARDLRDGKVSPTQLGECLGAVYNSKTPVVTLKDEGKEILLPEFIAQRLTIEAFSDSWFSDHTEAAKDELQFQFGIDLENHVMEESLAQGSDGDSALADLAAPARTALRITCAEWSNRLDQELFHGKRGSFLRLCTLLNLTPPEFESFFCALYASSRLAEASQGR